MSKPVIEVDFKGPEGNIFAVLSAALFALKKEMVNKVTNSKSYEDALTVIREYVEIKEV